MSPLLKSALTAVALFLAPAMLDAIYIGKDASRSSYMQDGIVWQPVRVEMNNKISIDLPATPTYGIEDSELYSTSEYEGHVYEVRGFVNDEPEDFPQTIDEMMGMLQEDGNVSCIKMLDVSRIPHACYGLEWVYEDEDGALHLRVYLCQGQEVFIVLSTSPSSSVDANFFNSIRIN